MKYILGLIVLLLTALLINWGRGKSTALTTTQPVNQSESTASPTEANPQYKFLRIIYNSIGGEDLKQKKSLLLQATKGGDIDGLVKFEDANDTAKKCQGKGRIQRLDFANLQKLLEKSKKVVFNPCKIVPDQKEPVCTIVKHMGLEAVTLFNEDAIKDKTRAETIFLDINTNQIHKDDWYFENGDEVKIRLQQFFNSVKCG